LLFHQNQAFLSIFATKFTKIDVFSHSFLINI